jgi:hypothetical protein
MSMTRGAIDHLERVLCEAYREEIDLYTQAVALCECRSAAPEAVDGWLPTLVAMLDRIAAVEARMAPAKAEWKRLGHAPDAALADCLRRMAELLRALAAAVDRVITDLQARRQHLPAPLEALSRSQRVQQAYQRIARVS